MKYTINMNDLDGKFTLVDLECKPLLFDTKSEAEAYIKNQGLVAEYISIEEESEG